MLQLIRLEVEGFGPFADRQSLTFPEASGVTVIYGENMRGKTSLLNAIRYAFFGKVVGRGSRERRLHTISNRELAAIGRFGFSVSLEFEHEGNRYELVRQCKPRVVTPISDDDYVETVLLRRGSEVLGPQQRERALQLIFPKEVSRFFLFDGELLQEYEELLISESDAGHRISEAIEKILGVPILKRGRAHLKQLSDEADKQAAQEASKHHQTQALGTALQQATQLKDAHEAELGRLQAQLDDLNGQRADAEQQLKSMQKYASILEEVDDLSNRQSECVSEDKRLRTDLQSAMGIAWRSLVREPLMEARRVAVEQSEKELEAYLTSLRAKAAETGRCDTCGQDVPEPLRNQIQASLRTASSAADPGEGLLNAMAKLGTLSNFHDADNAGEVRRIWQRISDLQIEQAALKDRLTDLNAALKDSDPESVRRTKLSYSEVNERIAIVKLGIEQETKSIQEKDQNIQRIKGRLEAAGSADLRASQLRARVLRQSSEVFNGAVERYKTRLRSQVETTASQLFRSMTTEKEDYAGLTINEGYGLTIRHKDGRAEEARSAGAEHVVALALMGALQRNAPLRGPIVMDSPFGRLDDMHTSNVIRALPEMAQQVVLLVYEAEVGKSRMRNLLGPSLVCEYELERVSARRTCIRTVR